MYNNGCLTLFKKQKNCQIGFQSDCKFYFSYNDDNGFSSSISLATSGVAIISILAIPLDVWYFIAAF